MRKSSIFVFLLVDRNIAQADKQDNGIFSDFRHLYTYLMHHGAITE